MVGTEVYRRSHGLESLIRVVGERRVGSEGIGEPVLELTRVKMPE
jgi:hypothetical protein